MLDKMMMVWVIMDSTTGEAIAVTDSETARDEILAKAESDDLSYTYVPFYYVPFYQEEKSEEVASDFEDYLSEVGHKNEGVCDK